MLKKEKEKVNIWDTMLQDVREEKFCQFMALDGKRAQSATRAGYAKSSSQTQSCNLLKKDYILKRIEVIRKKMADEIEMQAKEAIGIIQHIAREYKDTKPKEALEAAKLICKIKGVEGLSDTVIVKQEPFSQWTLQEIEAFVRNGRIPDGRFLPEPIKGTC